MKKLLVILLLIGQTVVAQKLTVKGVVVGPEGNPLPSATIILLGAADSSLVNFGVSKSNGSFELRNVNRAPYLLKVTFVGHKTFSYNVSPESNPEIVDVGTIKMEEANTELDEVVVSAEKAPVQIKGDTIEFNAGSFKTNPNANVEDLLKRLPGVEVDNDGTITAQGEQVQKVTVDGREFFGRDPKLATRNLPADAVDKVQVFDKKSDQAQFTGIDDGQREKTINLELKEEKRNGIFGNATGGAGTDERWTAKASLNRFRKGQQLSFLGLGNNINEQGFSIDDYVTYSGGLNSSDGRIRIQVDRDSNIPLNRGGRQNGIMTNYAGGLNFSEDLSKKTTLTSSYFFNALSHGLSKTTDRVSYYPNQPDLSFHENSIQDNKNLSHRVSLALDHKIDSANSLKLTSNINYNDTDVNSRSEGISSIEDGSAQNESNIRAVASGQAVTLDNSLLYRHKFGKTGRTLSSNLAYTLSKNKNDGLLTQDLTYYQPVQRDSTVNQRNSQSNRSQNYGINFSYTEPLGGRKYLEANYAIRTNNSKVERDVFDVEDGSERYNAVLSNRYASRYLYQRSGLNIKFNHKDYTLTAGVSYQFTDLNGILKILETEINKTFNNVLPALFFNYNFSSSKHLNFNYETSVQEPTVQQLSPVVDNSNALNIYIGNPSLSTSYNHRWMLNYLAFSPARFVSLFARANAIYTTNAIVNEQSVDQNYTTTTRPVNLGTTFTSSGNVSLGFPINLISSRINVSGNARHSKYFTLLNDVRNSIQSETVSGTLRYEYRMKDFFDISISTKLTNQSTRYEDESRNQSFLNQTYGAEGSLTFLKHYSLQSTFDYLVYANQYGGNIQRVPLLNISVSRYVLKAKSGEIKLAVTNLLDQNLGIDQTANNNYVEREVMNSLGRYFMVSFTYALNKQLNPMAGMRRGGMIIRD